MTMTIGKSLSLATIGVAFVTVIASGASVAQQAKQPTAAPTPVTQGKASTAPAQAPALKQVTLTDKQLNDVIAAQQEIDAITDKIPQDAKGPDPKVMGQIEEVVKKHGFAGLQEFSDVSDTIGLVMAGIDPKTKSYVGAEAMIKQQVAAVQAEKNISAKDKKAALDQLNTAMKSPPPAVENKANIELVTKYYDKLAPTLQGDE